MCVRTVCVITFTPEALVRAYQSSESDSHVSDSEARLYREIRRTADAA